jgi:hypothetical protein
MFCLTVASSGNTTVGGKAARSSRKRSLEPHRPSSRELDLSMGYELFADIGRHSRDARVARRETAMLRSELIERVTQSCTPIYDFAMSNALLKPSSRRLAKHLLGALGSRYATSVHSRSGIARRAQGGTRKLASRSKSRAGPVLSSKPANSCVRG